VGIVRGFAVLEKSLVYLLDAKNVEFWGLLGDSIELASIKKEKKNMKIKEIEIQNYRSCIKTKFALNTDLSVLIGPNGVGKSNILYGLQLFPSTERNRKFYNIDSEFGSETQINLIAIIDEIDYVIRAKFSYKTNEKNRDVLFYTEIKYREVEAKNKRKWVVVDSEILEYASYIFKTKRKVQFKRFETEQAKLSLRLLQSLRNINYYSATQFSDPSRCPVSIELDESSYSSTRAVRSKNHTRFIYDLYQAYKSSEPIYTLFQNTVGNDGLGLIESFEFFDHDIPSSTYKVRTGGFIEEIQNSKKIIIPFIRIDGLKLSPNQLSEGTFKTLALVFYILSDKSDLLLIEEPEVSVHHGLLSSIMQLIKQQSQSKQIIITTHSDNVLDMIEPENIVVVSKEREKGTIANPLTKSLGAQELSALRDYLQTTGNLGEYWIEGGFDYE